MWNADTGELVRRFEGHTGHIAGMAVFPDGQRMVSIQRRGESLRVWDLARGLEMLSLSHPYLDSVWNGTIRISVDGSRLTVSQPNVPIGWLVVEAASEEQIAVWRAEEAKDAAEWEARAPQVEKQRKARREAVTAFTEEERARASSLREERLARDAGALKQWLVLAPLPITDHSREPEDVEHLPEEALLRPRAGEQVTIGKETFAESR